MKKVKGSLYFTVDVECPECGHDFDIMNSEEQNDDACITKPLFNNDWDNCRDKTVCPKCDCEFEMVGVEY